VNRQKKLGKARRYWKRIRKGKARKTLIKAEIKVSGISRQAAKKLNNLPNKSSIKVSKRSSLRNHKARKS